MLPFLKRKFVKIAVDHHMKVHFFLALLSFTLIYIRFPREGYSFAIFLMTVSIICSYLPDLDHIIYIFTYGKNSEYGAEANRLLKNHQWTEWKFHAKHNHKEITGLYSHNIGMAFISLFLFFLFTYFLKRPLPSVAFLAIFLHFCYDIIEDKVLLGKLNPNWTFRFNDEEWRFAKIVSTFFKLIRLYSNAVTSLPFVFGYIAAKSYDLASHEELFILAAYLVLSPLMYGGIYILSEISSAVNDNSPVPVKKYHALFSEEITVRHAKIVAGVLITLSLIFGFFLSKLFFQFQLIFLAINFANLLFIKKIPFLNILSSSITHPLRTVAGILLAGGNVAVFSDLILTHALYNISTSSVKNKREFPDKTGARYLKLIQFASLTTLIIHFLITLDSPGLIFRIPYVLISAFALPLYKKSKIANNVINQWYYGRSF